MQFRQPKHREITPSQLQGMMRQGTILVVDVRERDEFADGHIPGAVNRPLSEFQPTQLPTQDNQLVVLNCAGGRRSGQALDKCLTARVGVDTHLAGGFEAWKSAGLPVER